MEAARVLTIRGHQVVLQEKEDNLGGKLNIASVSPYKEEMMNLVKFYAYEMRRLDVTVRHNDFFSNVADEFDGVIIAAGAQERTIDIQGMENLPCYYSSEILSGKAEPQDPAIIVGAGLVGGETADFLSSNGLKVSLVEIQEKAFVDMGVSGRWVLMERLKKGGVTIHTSSEVLEIKKGEVVVRTPGGEISLPAGCVIFAVGFEANDDLVEKVAKLGVPYCVIGDNRKPRRIKDAVHEGYWAATSWLDSLE